MTALAALLREGPLGIQRNNEAAKSGKVPLQMVWFDPDDGHCRKQPGIIGWNRCPNTHFTGE